MRDTTRCKKISALVIALGFECENCGPAAAYAFNLLVPDVRQPSSVSGGSACPVPAHQLTGAANLALRWSTALGSNPVTVSTQDQTPTGQLNEIAQTITTSLAVWTAVNGTSLTRSSIAPPMRVSTAASCGTDGLNSLCFGNCPLAAATPSTRSRSIRAVDPSQIANAMQTLCRNPTTDAGWPTQFSCVVPAVNTEFTARTRPGP